MSDVLDAKKMCAQNIKFDEEGEPYFSDSSL